MNEPRIILQQIEATSKTVIALLALFYVVGLLVTAFDLARSGIFVVDLARPQYILAGGLACVVILLPAGVLAALFLVVVSFIQRGESRVWHRTNSIICLMSVLAAGLLLWGSRGYMLRALAWEFWLGQGLFLISIASLTLEALGAFGTRPTLRSMASHVVVVLFLAFAVMYQYSEWLYPHFSQTVGGGQRPEVVLVLSGRTGIDWNIARDWGNVIIGSSGGDKPRVGPVTLILETQDRYFIAPLIVRPAGEAWKPARFRPAIGISKALVEAAIYYPERGTERSLPVR